MYTITSLSHAMLCKDVSSIISRDEYWRAELFEVGAMGKVRGGGASAAAVHTNAVGPISRPRKCLGTYGDFPLLAHYAI